MTVAWRRAVHRPEHIEATRQEPEPELAPSRPDAAPLTGPCWMLSPTAPLALTRPAIEALLLLDAGRTCPFLIATA